MNKPHKSFSVDECKIKASILLKSLHSDDDEKSKKSSKRFQRLPEFKQVTLEYLKENAKHKHALSVIALEKGFNSWSELKCQLPFIRGGFLNQWFANYAAAKSYQQSHNGFLFPYQKQFFICDANYVNHLGFDVNHPDWKLIGNDWVCPENKSAWKRLYQKWMSIQEAKS